MSKHQTDRLTIQHVKSKGVEGIFGEEAKRHDISLNRVSQIVFNLLKNSYETLTFRHRSKIGKKEINEKLKAVDKRLGVALFVANASIQPDGGVIEVKDKDDNWIIVLVAEAKHQGRDIENIKKGILVGKNKDQTLMVAGNAIERSHKNINEIRNIMVGEKHYPYVLFLQGSNFLTETITVKGPDGHAVELRYDVGSLNRIDRLTAANYSMPINENSCENIFITTSSGERVMLQAVSIFAKPTPWTVEEMVPILIDVAETSLRVLGLNSD